MRLLILSDGPSMTGRDFSITGMMVMSCMNPVAENPVYKQERKRMTMKIKVPEPILFLFILIPMI